MERVRESKPEKCVRLPDFFSDLKSQRAILIRHQSIFGRFGFFSFFGHWQNDVSSNRLNNQNKLKFVQNCHQNRLWMNGFNEHSVTVSEFIFSSSNQRIICRQDNDISHLNAWRLVKVSSRHWRSADHLSVIHTELVHWLKRKQKEKLSTACDFSLSNSHDEHRQLMRSRWKYFAACSAFNRNANW